MIDIFGSIAPNDQSLYYLGQIFGVVGNVLPPSMFPGGKSPIILSNLFQVLNSVALTVGVIVITYTTVMGLFKTAQDGEFLGKQWNKIWVPLRTVIGVAGLFPSANGYCALQVFLMWLVLQGISAADLLWTTAVNTIQRYGNPVSGGSPAVSREDIRNQMIKIFQGMTCQQAAAKSYDSIPLLQNPKYEITYYCQGKTTSISFCKPGFDLYDVENTIQTTKIDDPKSKFKRYNFGPEGSCGYFEYADSKKICNENPDSLICKTSTAQEDMMKVLFADKDNGGSLNVIAEQFVTLDNEFAKFYESNPSESDTAMTTRPEWITNYCTAAPTASPKGLGISAEECCVVKGEDNEYCQAYELSFKTNTDVYKVDFTGINSTGDSTVTNIYLPFGLASMKIKSSFIDTATDQYVAAVITKPTQEYLNSAPPPVGWYEDARKNGWLLAGSYYLKIAKENQRDIGEAAPHLVSNVSDSDVKDPAQGGAMTDAQRNLLRSTSTLLSNIENQYEVTSSTDTIAPRLKKGSATIRSGMNFLQKPFDEFMKSLSTGKGDPILSAAAEGQKLMWKASVAFAGVTAGIGAVSAVSNIAVVWMGNGLAQSPWWALVQGILGVMTPFAILLLVTMFSIGALLGVYVPLIPYIVFTVTSLGWFIGVIELMVAAPFIAIGIMAPGAQSEILGHAERSLMMVFNLFLRPSLMIIGMIAAMMLSNVGVTLINSMFSSVVGDIAGKATNNVFVTLSFTAAYTILIITILNKCFTLIHMLPERTLTYIGGQRESYGEEQALQQVKGAVESTAAQVGQSARTTAIGSWVTPKGKDKKDGKGGLEK